MLVRQLSETGKVSLTTTKQSAIEISYLALAELSPRNAERPWGTLFPSRVKGDNPKFILNRIYKQKFAMLPVIKFISASFRLRTILLLSCDQNDSIVQEISRLQNVAFSADNISTLSSVDSIFSCDMSMPSSTILDYARERPIFLSFGSNLSSSKLRFDSQVYLFDHLDNRNIQLWQVFSKLNGLPIVEEIGSFDISHSKAGFPRFGSFPSDRSLHGITLQYQTYLHKDLIASIKLAKDYNSIGYQMLSFLRNGRIDQEHIREIHQLDSFYQEWSNIFKEVLNFETIDILPKAGLYGYQLPNGSWDGVVGELSTKGVDISNLPLTHLPLRYEVL